MLLSNLNLPRKPWWWSNTIGAAVFLAVSTSFSEQIQTWISTHPGAFGKGVGALMIFLRLITTQKLFSRKQKCEHPECPNA